MHHKLFEVLPRLESFLVKKSVIMTDFFEIDSPSAIDTINNYVKRKFFFRVMNLKRMDVILNLLNIYKQFIKIEQIALAEQEERERILREREECMALALKRRDADRQAAMERKRAFEQEVKAKSEAIRI